ncbi:MAG: hypothetical protein M0Z66_08005 [Thermaerobacter sp.]|nr:hypothetical protein [Thermaerobacter sp.]
MTPRSATGLQFLQAPLGLGGSRAEGLGGGAAAPREGAGVARTGSATP